MKSIADIINDWKTVDIPLVEGVNFYYKKDCVIEERKDLPLECKITVRLYDVYTHVDGVFNNKCFIDVYETAYQNSSDETLKAIENKQFEMFLQRFTNDSVNDRRKELSELNMGGLITFSFS